MKKNIFYFISLCIVVLFVSCSDDNQQPASLTTEPSQITLSAEGTLTQMVVNTSLSWQISKPEYADWLTITPMQGTGITTVHFIADKNVEKTPLTATITIKADGGLFQTIVVTQNDGTLFPPSMGGIISGDNINNCPYTATVLLTSSTIAGVSSYQWYCNGNIVALTTEPTYAASTSGAYTVAGVNAAGTGTPGPEKRITITACTPPETAGAIIGNSENTCPVGTVALSVAPVTNAVSYQWYKDGVAISGATASTYEAAASGVYTVAGVNAGGIGGLSPEKTVTIVKCGFYYTDLLGNYHATGAPKARETKGPEAWDCAVQQPDDNAKDYYVVTNWGGGTNPIFIDLEGEVLKIKKLKIGTGGGYDAIQAPYTYANGAVTMLDEHTITWDADAKKISMGGTYQGNSILIGVLAVSPSTGAVVSTFTEGYENAVLTMQAGSPVMSGEKVKIPLRKMEGLTYESSKK